MLNVWPALLLVLLQGSMTPDEAGLRLAILRGLGNPVARYALAGYRGQEHDSGPAMTPIAPRHRPATATQPLEPVPRRMRLAHCGITASTPGHSAALRWRDGPR